MPTARTQLGKADGGTVPPGSRVSDFIDTNYRCAYGEVDIVAQEDEELVFVEVRTRHVGSYGTPQDPVAKPKLRRLLATCQDYVQGLGAADPP